MPEVDLYAPIKKFLEAQGYTVKGEIEDCDVVAVRGEEPPVVVELKQQLTLALLLQAVDRLAITETVYLAFRVGKGHSASWRQRRKEVLSTLRRLGLGLLTVSTANRVIAELDPLPYRPRTNAPRRQRLLKEFAERVGDPEPGGSVSRQRLTVYRQDAIRCARALRDQPVLKAAQVAQQSTVLRAGAILRANHYGWFDRVKLGHYALSPKGALALEAWPDS